jgi:hypothetical protein
VSRGDFLVIIDLFIYSQNHTEFGVLYIYLSI